MTAFTVTVAGGSRAYGRRGSGAHLTLHRADCPVVARAAENHPEYLSGWVADGRAVTRGTDDMRDTPAALGAWHVTERALTETHESGEAGNRIYARLHVEYAAAGRSGYRVCGRCKPDPEEKS